MQLNGRSSEPIGVVRVRYRNVSTGEIEEIERPIMRSDITRSLSKTSKHFRLAACVAEFSEILRANEFARGSNYEDVARLLRPVSMDLRVDKRVQELLGMVQGASSMPRGQ